MRSSHQPEANTGTSTLCLLKPLLFASMSEDGGCDSVCIVHSSTGHCQGEAWTNPSWSRFIRESQEICDMFSETMHRRPCQFESFLDHDRC